MNVCYYVCSCRTILQFILYALPSTVCAYILRQFDCCPPFSAISVFTEYSHLQSITCVEAKFFFLHYGYRISVVTISQKDRFFNKVKYVMHKIKNPLRTFSQKNLRSSTAKMTFTQTVQASFSCINKFDFFRNIRFTDLMLQVIAVWRIQNDLRRRSGSRTGSECYLISEHLFQNLNILKRRCIM